VSTQSISDAVLDGLAERIARIAIEPMLYATDSDRTNCEIAAFRAVRLTLWAVQDHLDPNVVGAFFDRLLVSVAR
jgi:hypothetical protein